MGHIFDELPDRPSPQRTWGGIVANNPSDFADKLEVIIPALSDTLRWKNCRWMSRNDVDMPIRGNKCLVVFNENNEIWVVAWDPFD